MSTIVLRSVKNAPLSNAEVDANFTNLNNDKTELGGTYSSGTANGVLFLSSSKVLTTGTALTFDGTTLGVKAGTNQNLRVASGGGVLGLFAVNDAVTLPVPLQIQGDDLRFNVASGGSATEQMRLTSTGLGIGTSSPAYVLNTNYSAPANFTNAGGDFTQMWQASGTNALGVALNTGDTTARFVTNNGYVFAWNASSSELMRLTSTGLGIGTSSPTYKLQLNSGSAVDIETGVTNSAGTSRFGTRGSGNSFVGSFTAGKSLELWSAGSQAATLDSSGNLGIGTSSPVSALGFGEVASGTGITFQSTNTTFNSGKAGAIKAVITGSGNGSLIFETYGGGSGGGERARITSSGGFKQQSGGASYEDTTLGYSEFNNGEVGTTALLQRCTNASFNGSVSVLKTSRAASTGFVFISAEANSVIQFSVRGDGNVYNTNNSYGAISDAKLKENVTDATPKLDKLNQVRVVNFNMIGSEQKQLGVIAQELEQVFPGMVDESPDRDAEGNDLGTTTKSVKYSVFVPMLIKALQEATTEINSLKARLDAANL
jgi:hypothetical protein